MTDSLKQPEEPGVPAAAARLVVEKLRIQLGDRYGPDVVDDVSFTVGAGEVLGLVGESGSGKTTVALALLGHARRGLTIGSGRVLLDGTDVLSLSPAALQTVRGTKVSYVPQDPAAALNPALRIRTQLAEVLAAEGFSGTELDSRLVEVARQTHLPSDRAYLRRYPHQLSGGQQQRVAIAMAFACRPSLIVLDEPTTGLDVSTQRHILDTVRHLTSIYGVAAVYVSHDLAVVGQLVSKVAVMYAGRVVELGETEKVFADPVHPYTRRLLAAIPSPERSEMLLGIEGQPPRPGRRPAGCHFAPRCDLAGPECSEAEPPPEEVAGRSVRCFKAGEPRSAVERLPRAVEARSGGTLSISVEHLTASYGRTEVLHDVSVSVPAETCLAIVGESGSGKTTMARCLVGLHPGFKGSISFGGALMPNSARRRPLDALRRVQYIFQNPYTALNPRKTVGQLIGGPLQHFFDLSRKERDERILQVLADVSLPAESMLRYPDELSGGERQRVAIARALVVEPDLLVCDEVTSSLDVSVQAVIVELLRRLQRERHLSLVFITHNIALVRSIAQLVAVLSDGHLVELGPVDDILDRPADPYTAQLMADVPKLGLLRTHA